MGAGMTRPFFLVPRKAGPMPRLSTLWRLWHPYGRATAGGRAWGKRFHRATVFWPTRPPTRAWGKRLATSFQPETKLCQCPAPTRAWGTPPIGKTPTVVGPGTHARMGETLPCRMGRVWRALPTLYRQPVVHPALPSITPTHDPKVRSPTIAPRHGRYSRPCWAGDKRIASNSYYL